MDRKSAADAQTEKELKLQKEKTKQEDQICDIKNKEIKEKIKQIESLYTSVEDIGDDEVLDLKSNLSSIDQELRDLRDMRDKFENLIKDFSNKEDTMRKLAADYKKTSDGAVKYKENLKSEIKKRELEDYKLKAIAKVSIPIPKFTGTDYKIDIYTFQTKFIEEHARLPKSKCLYQLKEKYLAGPAKEMVKLIDDIEEVWKVLKDAYGDPKVLLSYELDNVRKLGSLTKIRDHQELSAALSKLANAMENLKKTAETHSIVHELYNSHTEGLIYEIMGDQRVDRFLEKHDSSAGTSSQSDWNLMITFLRDEARRKSRMALKLNTMSASKSVKGEKNSSSSKINYNEDADASEDLQEDSVKSSTYQIQITSGCKCCGEASCDNKDKKDFEYVKCKKFREMKPKQRLKKLMKDRSCFQCLQPNHPFKKPCQEKQFGCPNEQHKTYNKTYHVVVCEEHQEEETNKKLLEEYKLKIFKKSLQVVLLKIRLLILIQPSIHIHIELNLY